MRFLADMGVARRIVEWLRTEGHEAVHLREEGLQRMPNGEIFRKAASEGQIILTFDLDFGEIVALSGDHRVSVILFRLHNTRTPHVIDRLRKVLKDAGPATRTRGYRGGGGVPSPSQAVFLRDVTDLELITMLSDIP